MAKASRALVKARAEIKALEERLDTVLRAREELHSQVQRLKQQIGESVNAKAPDPKPIIARMALAIVKAESWDALTPPVGWGDTVSWRKGMQAAYEEQARRAYEAEHGAPTA